MNEPITRKRLYRSRTECVVAGVCGGMGEYFNLDPVIFRIIWGCFAVFSAIIGALVVYLICWVAIPKKPESAPPGA